MNCIIIEDEKPSARHLENQLALTEKGIRVLNKIGTIEEAVDWLRNNQTDLIFLDIQLGDGISFEIFDHVQVKTPVIFTTSYDQYLSRAFEVNSISYLLKPVTLDSLKAALQKYDFLYKNDNQNEIINPKIFDIYKDYQKRLLLHSGSSMITLDVEDVAYFHIENRYLMLTTKDKQQHVLDGTLEVLEERLNPKEFFRLNRQFIINIKAISHMQRLDSGQIQIETNPPSKSEMIISAKRATEFRNWLNS